MKHSKTSLDSPPVKKSRRKVARILDDSSDEENEPMDSINDSLNVETNGHTDSNESERTMDCKENSDDIKQKENGDSGENVQMESPPSSNDGAVPKRKTGLLNCVE